MLMKRIQSEPKEKMKTTDGVEREEPNLKTISTSEGPAVPEFY